MSSVHRILNQGIGQFVKLCVFYTAAIRWRNLKHESHGRQIIFPLRDKSTNFDVKISSYGLWKSDPEI